MTQNIEFHFDFVSGYTYLAHRLLSRMASAGDAKIVLRPFNLLELMSIVGNRPTSLECANKTTYVMTDVRRCARHHDIRFTPNPHWQRIDFARLGRGALVAADPGCAASYVDAIFRAIWEHAADLSEYAEVDKVLSAANLSSDLILRPADLESTVTRFADATSTAARAGVFGSPTFFVSGDMYFGADRLEFLVDAPRLEANI